MDIDQLYSLADVVDATNTLDQARFFQENAEQIFHVVYETCMHHIEKIKRKDDDTNGLKAMHIDICVTLFREERTTSILVIQRACQPSEEFAAFTQDVPLCPRINAKWMAAEEYR